MEIWLFLSVVDHCAIASEAGSSQTLFLSNQSLHSARFTSLHRRIYLINLRRRELQTLTSVDITEVDYFRSAVLARHPFFFYCGREQLDHHVTELYQDIVHSSNMVEEMEAVTGFRFDHVFKVVLVGEKGVGKTSLAQRFAANAFQPSPPSTIGVDFSVRLLRLDNKRIKVQLWDTSGQESMRNIVPNYFRFAEAVIIVYDCTDLQSFLKVPEWLQMIRDYAEPSAEKIIVSTKCDLAETRKVNGDQAQNFANTANVSLFETSALRGDNVEEAFLSLIRSVQSRSDVGLSSRPERCLLETTTAQKKRGRCC